jgi:hypothetical protein
MPRVPEALFEEAGEADSMFSQGQLAVGFMEVMIVGEPFAAAADSPKILFFRRLLLFPCVLEGSLGEVKTVCNVITESPYRV